MVVPATRCPGTPYLNQPPVIAEETELHASFDLEDSAEQMATLFGMPVKEAQRLVAQAISIEEESTPLQGICTAYARDWMTPDWVPGMGIGSAGTIVPMLFRKRAGDNTSGYDKTLITAYAPTEKEVIACLYIPTGVGDRRQQASRNRRIQIEEHALRGLDAVGTPHLLKYYGREDGQDANGQDLTVLYMEHARGSEALQLTEPTATPLSNELLLLITKCVLEILVKAHQATITHRDIKAENIVFKLKPDVQLTTSKLEAVYREFQVDNLQALRVDRKQLGVNRVFEILKGQEIAEACLIDFGMATTPLSTSAEKAKAIGTSENIAPERFLHPSDGIYDLCAADLYSLGSTLFTLAYVNFVREPSGDFQDDDTYDAWKNVAYSINDMSKEALKYQYVSKAMKPPDAWTHFDTLVFTMLSPAPDKRGTAQSHLDMVNRLGMTLFSPDHEPVKAAHSRNGSYLCCTIS
ncbi:MAG: serine/threonine protein kinase [Chlamydiia bacterium]|nr:serine/threonine protein kinase [Chlamydiia bacterium]